MLDKNKVNILMVTGVYFPEVNGATLQCMRIVYLLKKRINFSILTTTKQKNLVRHNVVDGIYVFRSYIGNSSAKLLQIVNIFYVLLTKKIDIIHLHGFSSRSALIVLLSKLFHKKVVIKMTSFGHDDVKSIKDKGRVFFYIFSLADAYIGVSPIFKNMYSKFRLDNNKYYQIPNGVDTNLFKPLNNNEDKDKIRLKLGLPVGIKLILVVGHFSVEKSANHVLDAWLKIQKKINKKSGIIFIGNTDSKSFEVDKNLVDLMNFKSRRFINERIFFIEKTYKIEQYYQVSDIFITPSSREGLSNALLEAMSCGLPVISTRLEGVTDWVIEHDINGLLYSHNNIEDLRFLIRYLLESEKDQSRLGMNAKKTINDKFEISKTSIKIYNLYKLLLKDSMKFHT